MMMAIFDQDTVTRNYGESRYNDGARKGRKEGRKEGRREGEIRALWGLVQKERLTLCEAAEEVGLTVSEFEKRARELSRSKGSR